MYQIEHSQSNYRVIKTDRCSLVLMDFLYMSAAVLTPRTIGNNTIPATTQIATTN
jgi:hypothetical protein